MGSSWAAFIEGSLSATLAEGCRAIVLLLFPGQQLVFFHSLYKDRETGVQIPKPH